MKKETAAQIKSRWSKRRTFLQIAIFFITLKEILEILVNLISLIPGGIIITYLYNILIGPIITMFLAFVSFNKKNSNDNQALIKKITRLVIGFFGEAFLSILPLDLITILWIYYDEKKEFKKKIKEVKIKKI